MPVGAGMDQHGHDMIRVDALAWDEFQQCKPRMSENGHDMSFVLHVLFYHFE